MPTSIVVLLKKIIHYFRQASGIMMKGGGLAANPAWQGWEGSRIGFLGRVKQVGEVFSEKDSDVVLLPPHQPFNLGVKHTFVFVCQG